MGIQKHVQSLYPQGAHKNPDVCGHRHSSCLYVDIELRIQVELWKTLMYADISIRLVSTSLPENA